MIKKYSLKALQKAINHALALDESIPDKIIALHGKVLEIIVAPLGANFFILFEQEQLKLLAHYDGKPDTIIHSSPLGLIRLSFLPASKARSLFNDKIRLSGDVELGQAVKNLFDELDIDWEGHLAHFTGDVVAHQVGSLFRQGFAFKKQLQESFHHNMANYLHEELRLFPSREEIEDFYKDIDQLALDVERLQAHVNQFKGKHEID
ncbi:ubiquinone biosynthesis accessory factor UbiJ [Legionella clemsonensis]|uniref:Ubiquinone biosynthesis accessory factor UbiJ n=1 Tax=Legionella clemsonensis TaxID=1867846 RepID=A0A222P6C5_9GAMM|nr:SCP2 sterol-binding domain-containing protein [Legionella clemsonensis]ASQ47410.1 SCP-2 sterol transfer family protein [Legionella clemsonensis]